MDNFKIIYKILKLLESALDCSEFDYSLISEEQLGVSHERWEQLLIMLQKSGYIDNIKVYSFYSDKGKFHVREPISPTITLKGLEYLQENSLMKKAHNIAKGVVDLIP